MRLVIAAIAVALLAVGPKAWAGSLPPSQEGGTVTPVPRPKPAGLMTPYRQSQTSWPAEAGDWPKDTVVAERARCAHLLAGLNVTYVPQAPIGKEGGCGAPAPIEVSAISGVILEPAATLTCPMAAALLGWIDQVVQPAAGKDLKTQVTRIHTASSYVCRLRNNASTGKLSEHGKANALDMAGFSFATSKDVSVEDGWGGILQAVGLSSKHGFLEHVREGACRHFTTVLGPGSDPNHGDHFHVDVLQRKGGYRICQ